MRKYVVAAVVCLAMLGGIAQAQMRGFGGGSGGGVSFGGPRPAVGTHSWGMTRGFGGHRTPRFGNIGFSRFGNFPGVCSPLAGCFRPARFTPFGSRFVFDRQHRHRFIGGAFAFETGVPTWGGYGYGTPYYLDSSYDQDEAMQAQAADRQRMIDEINFDRRRDMELQRQLAELQAAQEASLARQQNAQPAPAQPRPEAQPMPAVLVFRDGRQMQVENYVITADRLFTLGPDQHRTIQLSDLDLNATVKANQDRGVSFAVPKTQAGK